MMHEIKCTRKIEVELDIPETDATAIAVRINGEEVGRIHYGGIHNGEPFLFHNKDEIMARVFELRNKSLPRLVGSILAKHGPNYTHEVPGCELLEV